jgi:hypothetical protein
MKYLVIKGGQGFGDRLEVLAMGVHYAMIHNLQVHVDWTDSVWSHGSESFYSYFDLIGIRKLESLDDIPTHATYYPSLWTGRIKEHLSYDPLQSVGQLDKQVFNADVIVLTSWQVRTLFDNYSKFSQIFKLVHPTIITEVRRRKMIYSLSSRVGVHVRGTDRIGRRGRDIPVQYLMLNVGAYTGHGRKPMVIVSDDKESAELFVRYYKAPILSSLSLQNTQSGGNHLATKEQLKVTKNELNIDMIVDFFTLTCCERIFTNVKDSRFAQMAQRLKRIIV